MTKESWIMLITINRMPNNGNITMDDYSPTLRTGNKCAENPVKYRSYQLEFYRTILDHFKKSSMLKILLMTENSGYIVLYRSTLTSN